MDKHGKKNENSRTPHGANRLEQLKAALHGPAATFFGAQRSASEQVRKDSQAAFGRMVDAHLLVCGVLGGVLLRTDEKRTQDGHLNLERRVLFASYVVGMPLCEQAIAEGRYLQALTLLRHEMETLAQVVSSHSGVRKHKKAAKMSVLREDIARIYGDLSAAAHSSDHAMASELLTQVFETEEAISTGTYFYPVKKMNIARKAFALHLLLTIDLLAQISIDYNKAHPEDGFGPVDQEALHVAMELMKAEGVVEDVPAG